MGRGRREVEGGVERGRKQKGGLDLFGRKMSVAVTKMKK